MNSSKIKEKPNTSLKHDSSNRSLLKNNLQKINQQSNSKQNKESYNSQSRKEPERTILKMNSLKDTGQTKTDHLNNIKKINPKKNKVVESKLLQTPNKNTNEKVKDSLKAHKPNQNNILKVDKTLTKKSKVSNNKSLTNQSGNASRINENKEITVKKENLKETVVNKDLIKVESKIKTIIQKDKKIYNILKKNNYEKEDNRVYYPDIDNNSYNTDVNTYIHKVQKIDERQIDKTINKNESDCENLNIKDLKTSYNKKNYLIEFDKNMEMKNYEETEENEENNNFNCNNISNKKLMEMTVVKRKEQYKSDNIELKSDLNTPVNKLKEDNREQNSSNNMIRNNNFSQNIDLSQEEDKTKSNKIKYINNTQDNNIINSSNNESEDSVYNYNSEIQSKLTNVVSGAKPVYNLNENYSKNIQKLKNDMNVSEGEEENISTRDKYLTEMYYLF